MGVVEQNIALVTKDNKNNTVLQYPLTTVSQVEGLGEILNASIKNITANNDSIIITKNDNSSGYIVIDNVQNATKAQKDSREQVIDTTYIKGLSISGNKLIYTKGDNTISNVNLDALINGADVYTDKTNTFTAINTFNGSVLNGYTASMGGGKIDTDVAKIIVSNNSTLTFNPNDVFGLSQFLTAKCCVVIIEGVGAPIITWQGCKVCIEAPTKIANKTTIVTFLIDDHNAYLVSANYEV